MSAKGCGAVGDFTQALPIASTVLQFGGQVAGGIATRNSDKAIAGQLDQAAGQAQASSQRSAIEQERQTALAQSRLRALAGGGASDPTIVDLAQGIAGQGEYQALSALYEGNDRAAGMRFAADTKRAEGANAFTASLINGAGTIFKAAPTLLEKYGKGNPQYDFKKSGYGGRY